MAWMASQTWAKLITASASRSSFARCCWASEISAGPEEMRVSETNGEWSRRSAARAICPPSECPTRCTGVPTAAAWASTSCANSAWA